MIIQDSLKKFGDYVLLMRRVFTIPDRWREFFKRYISEIYKLGIDSIPIVITISVFIGAVIAIQMQKNVVSPMIPAYAVGLATRDVILLEFSSSILCLILAGKVGSNIASEIGTMRVTQQIDALEIMGVNSAGYLILPKIIALMTMIPFLVIFSIFSGIIGAFCTCWFGGVMNAEDLAYGLQYSFQEWFVWCSFIKSIFFAFIISSVSAYFGYTVEGGSIAVGKASTDSVVMSSVLILFSDLVLPLLKVALISTNTSFPSNDLYNDLTCIIPLKVVLILNRKIE